MHDKYVIGKTLPVKDKKMVVPIFGRFDYYVWDTKVHDWVCVSFKEYKRLKKHGRDVMYLRKE